MRLYARSDVAAVIVPAESGGCGSLHARPVIDGAPASMFILECPACTSWLKDDPQWATDKLKIPLTPDEESVAAEMEKKGDQVMHQVSAALAQSSIKAMRDSQAESIDAWKMQQERDAAESRYRALQAELAELRQIVSASVSSAVSTDSAQEEPQAPEAAAARTTTDTKPRTLTASSGRCTSCGGPLRAKGARGPTPKGTCMTCRAKARGPAA